MSNNLPTIRTPTVNLPMKMALLAAALAMASGCATSKRDYYINAGGHFSSYTENYDAGLDSIVGRALGRNVTTTSGDNSRLSTPGFGFQLGITERFEKISGEVNFFYVRYNPITYGFDVEGSEPINRTTQLTSFGLNGSLGFDIGWFRPQFYYKLGRMQTSVGTSTEGMTSGTADSGLLYLLGGGLAARIPFSKSFALVAQGNYLIPLNPPAGASINEITAHLGIEFFAFELKGK